MKYGIYAIFDTLAEAIIGAIWTAPHEAVAIRMFSDAVLHKDSRIPLHAEDYCLVRLGYIENQTIEPSHSIIITAQRVIAAQPKPEAE